MTSFQSSELTELPVVENSQLFAQCTVRPLSSSGSISPCPNLVSMCPSSYTSRRFAHTSSPRSRWSQRSGPLPPFHPPPFPPFGPFRIGGGRSRPPFWAPFSIRKSTCNIRPSYGCRCSALMNGRQSTTTHAGDMKNRKPLLHNTDIANTGNTNCNCLRQHKCRLQWANHQGEGRTVLFKDIHTGAHMRHNKNVLKIIQMMLNLMLKLGTIEECVGILEKLLPTTPQHRKQTLKQVVGNSPNKSVSRVPLLVL